MIEPLIMDEIDLLNDECVPKNIRHLVKAYIQLCISTEPFFKGLAPLCTELEMTKGAVSRLISQLKNCGAVSEYSEQFPPDIGLYPVVKLVNIRKLYNTLKAESERPKGKGGPTSRVMIQQAEELMHTHSTGMYTTLQRTTYNRIDQLFCIVDAAMKTSTKDIRKFLEVNYYFKQNDFIKIQAVTATGIDDDIANLSDQRVMRVINGHYAEMVRARLESDPGFEPDGFVSFDLHTLCQSIGLIPDIRNKQTVRRMINRLVATEFRIDASKSDYFKQTFGCDHSRFRYLTECKAVSELEKIDDKHDLYEVSERYYRVRIHSDIVNNIINDSKLFISHPRLARERVGLAHRISNWCKAVVGVSPGKDRIHKYTLDMFHEKVYPAATSSNFKRDLFRLARREYEGAWKEGEGVKLTVTIYGYIFQIAWDQAEAKELTIRSRRRLKKNMSAVVITIERDPGDMWVGDDSDHNKTKRLQMINSANFGVE